MKPLLPAFTHAKLCIRGKEPTPLTTLDPNTALIATKGALLTLARTLSGELISRGIRVNAITGGPIATPLYHKLGMGEAELKTLHQQIPARRLGKPVGSSLKRWFSLLRTNPHSPLAASLSLMGE